MATNAFKYFEDGFLTLNLTGGTAGGKVLLRLTDISLKMSRDIDETVTFDNNFNKVKNPTFFNWSVSASGVISSDTGESEFESSSSGDTRVINTYNGLELIDVIKTKTTSAYVYMKIASATYQKGKVIVSSFEVSGSVGSKLTYSIEMQGSGSLTTATS
jgi:hypothetical protein